MRYYLYATKAGAPQTGLVMAWESLLTGENGTDKSASAPAISEVGGGYYTFEIDYGTAPWDVTGEDLLGVVDMDSDAAVGLTDAERYKPVVLTVRSLALAYLIHPADVDLATGDVTVLKLDGTTSEQVLNMTQTATELQRRLQSPGA